MYKLVPKRSIQRITESEENDELRNAKEAIALAAESDDEMFQELILLHRDDMRMLNSEEGETIKRDFDRISRGI